MNTKNKRLSKTIFICFELSIILFSFAPWLSVASTITYMASRLLYLLIFATLLWTLIVNKRYSKIGLIYLLLSILIICAYFFISYSIISLSAKANDLFNLVLPFLMCLILYAFNGISVSEKYIKILIFTFYACVVINCIYGLVQVIFYSNNINGLYLKNISYHLYDYYRNGRLRAFGFLSSPTILSNYLGLAIIPLLFKPKVIRDPFVRWGLLILTTITLYLTGSRIPFYGLIIAFICTLIIKRSNFLKVLISFLSIFAMLIFLNNTSVDLSAAGRLTQYERAWNLVVKDPLGYGLGYASYPDGVINFDSGLLDFLVNFGLFISIIFLIIYCALISSKRINNAQKALVIYLFVISGFVNTVHSGTLICHLIIFIILKDNLVLGSSEKNRVKIPKIKFV